MAPITVRRYIASGRLAAVKIGRGVRIRREAIEGLLTPLAPEVVNDPDEDETFLEGKPFTFDDPLWGIVGMFDSGPDGPTDVSTNKHKYLAEAYADLHENP